MEPTYRVFDDEGKTYEIGTIEGSKPRSFVPTIEARSINNVHDIVGAQPNTKGLGVFEFAKRQNEPFS